MKTRFPLAAALSLLAATAGSVRATDYSIKALHSFSGTDGLGPEATLIQGADGDLYGTTCGEFYDSSNSLSQEINGTIFKITTAGKYTHLHTFSGAGGSHPMAPLVQTSDGLLWGTSSGGFGGNGVTIFHMKPDGTEFVTVFHGPAEVGINNATLVLGKDGNLYGTERQNGKNNYGRVFRLVPGTGQLTVLHNFLGHPDGEFPNGPLVQGKDGNFYGCTGTGGNFDEGTIFRISSTGDYLQLHALGQNGTQGSGPIGLVQAGDGNFYGVCQQGGNENFPPVGVVFRLTPAGAYTEIYNLGTRSLGVVDPVAALILGKDGALYGTGKEGGDRGAGYGGVFRITTSGDYRSIYGFDGTNGAYPFGGLVQAKDGHFYGTVAGKMAETDSTSGGDQYGKILKFNPPASADPAAGNEADAENGAKP